MVVFGDEPLDALLVVDRLQHLQHLVEGGGQLQAGLLDQVVASRGGHVDVGDPWEAVQLAGLVLEVLDDRQEIVCPPVGRGLVRILDVLVDRVEPAGAEPASAPDEGDVKHVVGAALGGQLQVGPLVVDREGRRLVVDRHAGLLLELRDVLAEPLRPGAAPARDVEGGASELLGDAGLASRLDGLGSFGGLGGRGRRLGRLGRRGLLRGRRLSGRRARPQEGCRRHSSGRDEERATSHAPRDPCHWSPPCMVRLPDGVGRTPELTRTRASTLALGVLWDSLCLPQTSANDCLSP